MAGATASRVLGVALAALLVATGSLPAEEPGTGTRPAHVLTRTAADIDAHPFFVALRPDSSAGRVARHVADLSRAIARGAPDSAAALADAHAGVGSVLSAACDRGQGFTPLAPPFAELEGVLQPPVVNGQVTAQFGPRLRRNGRTYDRHSGISYRVTEGEQVVAVARGVVVHAGPIDGLGTVVVVEHGGGYHTVYGHLVATRLRAGDVVAVGGGVGQGGGRTAHDTSEVYFEVRHEGVPQDPGPWLR